MVKTIDLNTASKKDLQKFVRNNSVYVNQAMKELETHDKETSNAYRYIQDKTDDKNKYFKSEDGIKRFKTSTKKEVENLSINELRQVGKLLQDYKLSKTGSLYKYNQVLDESYQNFSKNFNKQTGGEISKADFETLVKSKNWKESKEKYGSNQVLKLVGNYDIETALQALDSDVETIVGLYKKASEIKGTPI